MKSMLADLLGSKAATANKSESHEEKELTIFDQEMHKKDIVDSEETEE